MHQRPERPWSPAQAETELPWPPGAAILPLPTQADSPPQPAAPPSPDRDARLAEAVVAPLLGEIAALRAEVQRLQGLPAEVRNARRRDLVAMAAIVVVALAVAVLVLALVLRG